MLGISADKILIILVAAVFLLGPERLPRLAVQVARIIRRLRDLADSTTEQVRRELGDDYKQIDWHRLDPRQYDPRRIIREALLEDPPAPVRTNERGPRVGDLSGGDAVRAAPADASPDLDEVPAADSDA